MSLIISVCSINYRNARLVYIFDLSDFKNDFDIDRTFAIYHIFSLSKALTFIALVSFVKCFDAIARCDANNGERIAIAQMATTNQHEIEKHETDTVVFFILVASFKQKLCLYCMIHVNTSYVSCYNFVQLAVF